MQIWEILLLGIALATDAFALTVANCATYEKSLTKLKEWSMPTAFAVFQFLMPVIGFFAGRLLVGFISSFAEYLTAGIFFILAVKIVFDKLEIGGKKNGANEKQKTFTFFVLILQAIATSIDALAVGITFAATLNFSVFIAAGIIGVVTFILVSVALIIGKSLGKLLGSSAVWLGAVILFGLSIKSLISAIV